MAAKIIKRAKKGRRIKPVVLVDTPDTDPRTNLKVIDGHHRTLAYIKVNRPVWGYTAKVAKTKGPWDEFHAQQFDAGQRETTDDFAAKAAWEHELRGHHGEWVGLEAHDYEGTAGDRSHITRTETGMIPTSAIARLKGAGGEQPGEHRNRQGAAWEDFKQQVAKNGITSPVFITVAS